MPPAERRPRPKMSWKLPILTAAIVFVVMSTFYIIRDVSEFGNELPTAQSSTVTVNGAILHVDVATTEPEWVQGLSGRVSLAPDTGMLFVFDHDSQWGIWMKDMNFPLDIIWADHNGQIVYIQQNVATSTYPEDFEPSTPARYVIELPVGTVKAHGIALGQTINIGQ